MGFPGICRRGLVWLGWSYVFISLGELWVIVHVLRILHSDVSPQLSGMVGTRMTTGTRDDLARRRIHRDPVRRPVRVFPTKLHRSSVSASRQRTAPETAGSLLESTSNHLSHLPLRRGRSMPNHDSRQLFALERRFHDQVASHRMVQRLARRAIQRRRTPAWLAAPVVWTCRAHINDGFKNLGNRGSP